ncbi:SpoIIE family protein phosphatase [Candidatus Dependentiae bacterium]|nr:SpoIIE family protein phosphatase [Candidatus Dependentiae bacterium]
MFKKLSTRISFILSIILIIVMFGFGHYMIQERVNEMNETILQKGVASAKTASVITSRILEDIVDNGIFTLEEVLNHSLTPIQLPDFILKNYKSRSADELESIQKYHYTTTLDSYLDNVLLEIQDEFLKDKQIVYAVLADSNGFIPTHNSVFNKKLTGKFIFDRDNNRTKRVYDDEVGLKSARNKCEPFLKQVYKRDTGEVMWDISAPVYVKGHHWGAFRVGYSMEATQHELNKLRKRMLMFMLLMVLVTIFTINRVTAIMMKPLCALRCGVEKVAMGDLSFKQEVKSNDEVGDLARGFNKMTEDLRIYIDDLKRTTMAKEKIESDLRIATEIQGSMLPRVFPAFPHRDEFDIHATMIPAKEVGGDFYDFFFINKNELCFLIGDVSGKGVSAALFMVICKTLLKTEALRGLDPANVLTNVNVLLYPDNDACMFATVFLAILNTKTGKLKYGNAGHNPPILYKIGKDPEYIKVETGLVLGVMDEIEFGKGELDMEKDDILYIYTDGVTEAMDDKQDMFGEERLLEIFNRVKDESPEQIISTILKELNFFVKIAPQTDDITMVTFKYFGKKEKDNTKI